MPETAPDRRGKHEREPAGEVGRDAHETRPVAVDGSGAQRLAVDRAAEELRQQHDEGRQPIAAVFEQRGGRQHPCLDKRQQQDRVFNVVGRGCQLERWRNAIFCV